ncbi:MAG: DUF1992 domain-containing protein [Desulfovibrionaceae bacterium]|nr:DUF1992 domain-containing protein [Desulfovibrionaceae bacterium]
MSDSPFSAIQFIAEQRINESIAKGEFDNLPGKGQPLDLEDMSNVPEELRMAYRILRNAGCLPPEVQERKDISNLLELLEKTSDEHVRVAGMQKLRFMVTRSKMRFHRDLRLEQEDPYYAKVLERLCHLEQSRT